jgi:hypothetical protein
MRPHLNGLIALLTVVFLIAGCTSSDDTAADETTTTEATAVQTTAEAPAATVAAPVTATTAAPTTTTTAPELSGVVLDVTFTGEECIFEGPTDFPAAEPVEIVFVNESEEWVTTGLYRFLGDETFQDFLDYMGPGPATPYPPPWVDFSYVTRPMSGPKTKTTWKGNLEPARYYLLCQITDSPSQTTFYWYGAQLTVEE